MRLIIIIYLGKIGFLEVRWKPMFFETHLYDLTMFVEKGTSLEAFRLVE